MIKFLKTVYATDLETGECWIHEERIVELPSASGFSFTDANIYYEGVFQTLQEAELDDLDEDPDSFEIV